MTLQSVEQFTVPRDVVARTESNLRAAGQDGFEMFVLWSGTRDGARFNVCTAHTPRQTSYRLKRGLLVKIEGEALHKLNLWLYESGETLGAQIHAHPTDAYHSETDDSFPIVTTLGGLSLVVPDFCSVGLLDERSVAYRLTPAGWAEDPRPVANLIRVA